MPVFLSPSYDSSLVDLNNGEWSRVTDGDWIRTLARMKHLPDSKMHFISMYDEYSVAYW